MHMPIYLDTYTMYAIIVIITYDVFNVYINIHLVLFLCKHIKEKRLLRFNNDTIILYEFYL